MMTLTDVIDCQNIHRRDGGFLQTSEGFGGQDYRSESMKNLSCKN